jgi:orotidine-5'-phosphate decarboxylase
MSARDRLVLSLDVDDAVVATRLATRLAPWFATVKVGLELCYAAGPSVIVAMRDLGFRVFADLKLHDIPHTVERACRVVGSLGPAFVTLHAAGGEAMLAAGVAGLREGAARAGEEEVVALGVTVLTSEPEVAPEVLRARVERVQHAGCQGFVCAVPDLPIVRPMAPSLVAMVTGIREEGAPHDDQARIGTARAALTAGADYVVVGRTVTAAVDPEAAAASLSARIEGLS